MFKKLLNVGKGHSSSERLQQQQQQQQQKNLFQLNEIRSYGFSHLCCLGYSASLSLLAVGSKNGLLRVLGNSSVEFSYQLESGNAIKQIEFIDCRSANESPSGHNKENKNNKKNNNDNLQQESSVQPASTSAKLIVHTENGQLHLFELKTVRQSSFSDNTTQTEGSVANDCCQQLNRATTDNSNLDNSAQQTTNQNQNLTNALEYTKLEHVGVIDYFILEDKDSPKRVTTFEIASGGNVVFVGTQGGNLYQVPLDKFEPVKQVQPKSESDLITGVQRETGIRPLLKEVKEEDNNDESKSKEDDEEVTAVNLNDEPHIEQNEVEPFGVIKFEDHISSQLGNEIKPKKQGAIESIKKHPASNDFILLSYHRGLSVIYDTKTLKVEKYFYHNQILESSCFASSSKGDFFYTSHNDGSYIRWDVKKGSQSKADDDLLGQLYGPYPCKPTPKIQACTGLVNDQLEDLIIFSGGMPRATFDDKNPVTIVRAESNGKDTIKMVLDFTSKVLDFVVITRPRGNLGAGAKSTGGSGGGGGKKGKKQQQQQQQQQRNQPIAVALAILAEEEFVVIDLLNSESYLEFPLPYLNCVQPSAITCNQHYSEISDELYEQLLAFNRQQLKGKFSQNDWPISGGKVIDAPDVKSHDILLTGHEDGSVNVWDVSDLSMRHLLKLQTSQFFTTDDDDLVPMDDGLTDQQNAADNNQDDGVPNNEFTNQQDSSAWPPLKRVGRFDPYSDDTRLAIRKISLCPHTGTLLVAGTGGQVLVFELKGGQSETSATPLTPDEVTIVSDQRFTWKGREKLGAKLGGISQKFEPGYQLVSYVQLNPPASVTSSDLRSDWHLFAVGTSYGFLLYDYANKHSVINRCTLNVQDFAIVSGDGGAMTRKKSFRKSLRESFRRLRRGRSQRQNQAPSPDSGAAAPVVAKQQFGRGMTGVRTLNQTATDTAQQAAAAHRNLHSGERQVEPKVELSSIVKCITLTPAIITNNSANFKPSLWVGTNSGQVLVYSIELASEQAKFTTDSSAVSRPTLPKSSSGTAATTPAAVSEQLAADQQESSASTANDSAAAPKTTARLTKEIQLKHKAPIIAIFVSPEAPPQQVAEATVAAALADSAKSTPEKQPAPAATAANESAERKSAQSTEHDATANDGRAGVSDAAKQPSSERAQSPAAAEQKSPSKSGKDTLQHQQQARVLICSEEQFKVFNLPNLKPFCKFKLTAHEGLRAKKISITQFIRPAAASGSGGFGGNKQQTSSSSSMNLSSLALSASKSLQSFATQTSPPASPVPPAVDSSSAAAGDGSGEQSANGATSSAKQRAENNNNLLSAVNNNNLTSSSSVSANKQQGRELLNAKFGAKANSTTSNSSPSDKLTAAANDSLQMQNGASECGAIFEPYMVCMSNQGDCAVYSVPDLKRQAQIQVCKREDVNGITSAMLTNYGEGYYLKSSSNFLRFSISSQRVLRVLSVV